MHYLFLDLNNLFILRFVMKFNYKLALVRLVLLACLLVINVPDEIFPENFNYRYLWLSSVPITTKPFTVKARLHCTFYCFFCFEV